MNEELKKYLLSRDDVNCFMEYGIPKIKGFGKKIATKIGTAVSFKAGGVAVKKIRPRVDVMEGGKFLKAVKFGLMKADEALGKPAREKAEKKAEKLKARQTRKADAKARRLKKKLAKRRKKGYKPPFRFKALAAFAGPFIEKIM
ncbi:MAG: hypothetical protein K6F92_10650 [Lachnospiraceae bacterium]|nr:hypothetical protein [Lachnospiraceae bacterium]